MVANKQENSNRYKRENIETLLKAQIDNSLEVGWKLEDIIVLSNFEFEFMNVKAVIADLNESCLTGSKIFGLKWFFERYKEDDIIWAHDLDAWQNVWFEEPFFDKEGNILDDIKDVGCATYSNWKFNGGNLFWKQSGKDIVEEIANRIITNKEEKEEPTLNKVFKSEEYKDRVSVLNYSYNVGCSGFIPRFDRSVKPIRICHFHPYNGTAWEIHALGRDDRNKVTVTIRLERLLRKYYPNLATKLRKKKIRKTKEVG